MQKSVDCLIIGAGPSGLTLGIGLLKQKKSVLIVEKHLQQLPYSKAILVNSDTLRQISNLGVAESLKKEAILVDGFSLYAADILVSSARFDRTVANVDHPISVPQVVTEQKLLSMFLNNGGQLERGVVFDAEENRQISQSFDGPFEILLRKEHSNVTVRCDWLFGADGVHSAVRKAMQINYVGYNQNEERYILDAEVEEWPLPTHVSVWFSMLDARFVILINQTPLVVRIVGTTRDSVQQVLKHFTVRRILWDGAFTNSYRLAGSYGRGRVWLVGDAAHVHSPIGGRGMNIGIQEAVALARAVESGDLKGYEGTCRPVALRWVLLNFLIAQVVMSQHCVFRLLRGVLTVAFWVLGGMLGPRFAMWMFVALTTAKVQLLPPVAAAEDEVIARKNS